MDGFRQPSTCPAPQTPPAGQPAVPFLGQVTAMPFLRSGPSTDPPIVDTIRDYGVYTIVETAPVQVPPGGAS